MVKRLFTSPPTSLISSKLHHPQPNLDGVGLVSGDVQNLLTVVSHDFLQATSRPTDLTKTRFPKRLSESLRVHLDIPSKTSMQSGPAAAICTYLLSGWHIVKHQQVLRLQCRHAIAACLKVIQDSHPAYIQTLLSGCMMGTLGPVVLVGYCMLSATEERLQKIVC